MTVRRGDRIVYTGVALVFIASLVLSFSLFFPFETSSGVSYEVLSDGVRVRAGVLPDSRGDAFEMTVEFGGGFNVLSVAPDGVAIVSADCRGGDCLRFPRTGRPGGTLVCLPHKLVVRIIGRADNAPDDGLLDALDAIAY